MAPLRAYTSGGVEGLDGGIRIGVYAFVAFALQRRSPRVGIQKAESRLGRVVTLPATRASILFP